MGRISLTMIVKNEQSNLSRCLLSAREYVDEIIIVDTGSIDETKKIAIEHGARVYDFIWTNSFAEARNYALQQSTGDWILVLDADEQLAPETAHLIREFTIGPPAIGRVTIVSKYLDNGEIRYTRSPISRLFPRGVYYKGNIHEQVISDLPHRLTGVTVYHDGYYETDKTERNLPLLQQALLQDPESPYLNMQLAREWKNKQLFKEADHYFSKAYRLATGNEGYYSNLVVDYLYNLIKIGKLEEGYEVIQGEQEALSMSPDFFFAAGMFYMDYVLGNVAAHLDKLPLIETSFRRCLELGERKENGGVMGTGSFFAAYNLGVYYEVVGETAKALHYYQLSARQKYTKAIERLQLLTNG